MKFYRAYRYTKTGWGNPSVIYGALHDGHNGIKLLTNHGMKGKPFEFKVASLRDAIRASALKVEGVPLTNQKQVKPIRLDPRIAAHLNFDFGNDSGVVGSETYADLRLTPVEAVAQLKQGVGRPSNTLALEKLYAENKDLVAKCTSQMVYAEILRKAALRQKIHVSTKTIQRFLNASELRFMYDQPSGSLYIQLPDGRTVKIEGQYTDGIIKIETLLVYEDGNPTPVGISLLTPPYSSYSAGQAEWLELAKGHYQTAVTTTSPLVLDLDGDGVEVNTLESLIYGDSSVLNLPNTQFTINGTSGNDIIDTTLTGNAWDVIDGGAGDDTISAGGGSDVIHGGLGTNTINAGAGDDTVYLEGGVDTLSDYGGIDIIKITNSAFTASDATFERVAYWDLHVSLGGSLAFVIVAQFAQNTGYEFLQFSDNSQIDLNSIRYTLNGTASTDSLTGISYGGDPDDIINGLGGNDYLYGEIGDDTLNGGLGADTLYGGEGDDLYKIDWASGADTVSDSSGYDTIEFDSSFNPANISFTRSGANLQVKHSGTTVATIEGQFQGDNSYTVEALKFASSTINLLTTAMTFTGTSGADYIDGGDGIDHLYGGNGNDYLYGAKGDDRLEGGAGDDTYIGGLGDDTFYVGTGHDYIYENAGEGTDTIVLPSTWLLSNTYIWNDSSGLHLYRSGSTANDVLVQNPGSVHQVADVVERIVFGDASYIDMTTGLQLNDDNTSRNLYGSDQSDLIKANGGDDVVYAYAGHDTVYGGAGIDNVYGGDGDDVLYGEAANDTLYGDAGADTLYGGANNDYLYGGDGNDWIYGNAGINYMTGGAGADVFKLTTDSIDANMDYVTDFSTADGDALDIHDLLIGYNPLTSAITDFVNMTDVSGNTLVKIDRDGAGTSYSMTSYVTFNGVTGLTDEAALLSSNNLIV